MRQLTLIDGGTTGIRLDVSARLVFHYAPNRPGGADQRTYDVARTIISVLRGENFTDCTAAERYEVVRMQRDRDVVKEGVVVINITAPDEGTLLTFADKLNDAIHLIVEIGDETPVFDTGVRLVVDTTLSTVSVS